MSFTFDSEKDVLDSLPHFILDFLGVVQVQRLVLLANHYLSEVFTVFYDFEVGDSAILFGLDLKS